MPQGRSRVGLLVLVVVGVGLAVWVGWGDRRPDPDPSGAAPGDAGARSVPAAPIAEAGMLVRARSALPAGSLEVLFADAGGRARVCALGGTPALSRVTCAEPRASMQEIAERLAVSVQGDLRPPGAGAAARLGELVVWTERREGAADLLRARRVDGAGAAPGAAPIELGEVAAGAEAIHGCDGGEGLVIVTDGKQVSEQREMGVVFATGDAFSTPAVATAQVADLVLTCRGREASLAWLVTQPEGAASWLVRRVRCTPGACRRDEVVLTPDGSDPMLADLGRAVLLARVVDGDARVRLAPLAELATATDLPYPPAPSRVLARHLLAHRDAAVLLERMAAGTRAMRIGADGAVTPLSP